MPKIVLRNTQSGKNESFEPIDAREILANPDTIYEVPDESRQSIGAIPDGGLFDKDGNPVNVAQLQGGDAEMQLGLSVEKYGRSNVVKAQVGSVLEDRVLTTSGVVRTAQDPTKNGRTAKEPEADAAEAAEAMTVVQLKEALDARGVEYGSDDRKADLVAKFLQK